MPLKWAASEGHMDMVKLYLDKGAAVDARGLGGWTPLAAASSDSHLKIVDLVEKGADLTIPDSDGQTTLFRACQSKDDDLQSLSFF
ncbi:hypothetical protein N7532_008557 [Penicillium argentinense]|uniref:Uncharacterized protein n=1 Tax=Penicillium argentinense TaxID=1131581 RepID=A0A9W9EXK5_9EURO|nr:uncharacterized protein N7532_008557 [Penicillium argentinense]KAJ5089873.1 hypothetical protein N7532_008557 [Penicillium argentinense]